MKLFTKAIETKLLANGERFNTSPDFDPLPVVKLFTPDAGCTWLLASIDPAQPDIAYGLCDLGLGTPEIGSVSISELRRVRGKLGLHVERDRHFRADRALSAYAADASQKGTISV